MSNVAVTEVEAGPRRVARSVRVAAPASELFDVIANPHRHAEIDGSGTVRDVQVKGPERLSTGDKFTVGMKQFGVPYKITSTATVVETNRTVEWQHPLGHRWRWDLAEVSPGTTEVTETFDYSTAKSPKFIELTGYDRKNADGIESTLRGLAGKYLQV